MNDPQQKESKEECVLCKFALAFAFAVLLITMVFVFFMKLK